MQELSEHYPDEGIIPFYLGKIAMAVEDEELAMKYLAEAEEKGYDSAELFLAMGLLLSPTGNIAETEKRFLEAEKASETLEMRWGALSALAVFYLQHEMFLKVEKIAKTMIADYPNNYQGYHIHIMAEAIRDHYDEVNSYMEKLPDMFKIHPQYLTDVVEIYKKQGKTDELLKLFEFDNRFEKYIPQVVLREKINALPSDQYRDQKEKLIYRLAKEYHDSDAVVSAMILEFSKMNFKASSVIANVVLDNEKESPGLKYYLALFFQIFNFYYLAEKKPSAKLRKWIEEAGNWCIEFAAEFNLPEVSDIVSASIQELFDEINR